MLQKFSLYLNLIRFSHTIFAMPFAIVGVVLAYRDYPSAFSLEKFLLIILCMVFARTSAMAFNRYLDRNIDALNPRTRSREIPSGKINSRNAMILTLVSIVLFLTCTYRLNILCFYLSPAALLVILGYSYTKRFTYLCHVFLGLGLSLAPIGAYIAITNHFSLSILLIALSVLFWVSGFDIIYAIQDEEFDKKNSLYSIPAFVGRVNSIYLSRLLHTLSVFILTFNYILFDYHLSYLIGLICFTALLLYEHLLVTPKDISKINFAFGILNSWAGVIFGFFVILDILIN